MADAKGRIKGRRKSGAQGTGNKQQGWCHRPRCIRFLRKLRRGPSLHKVRRFFLVPSLSVCLYSDGPISLFLSLTVSLRRGMLVKCAILFHPALYASLAVLYCAYASSAFYNSLCNDVIKSITGSARERERDDTYGVERESEIQVGNRLIPRMKLPLKRE